MSDEEKKYYLYLAGSYRLARIYYRRNAATDAAVGTRINIHTHTYIYCDAAAAFNRIRKGRFYYVGEGVAHVYNIYIYIYTCERACTGDGIIRATDINLCALVYLAAARGKSDLNVRGFPCRVLPL